MPLSKRALAEFFGTFWLVFGGCGSAVLAAGFSHSASSSPGVARLWPHGADHGVRHRTRFRLSLESGCELWALRGKRVSPPLICFLMSSRKSQ